MAFMLLVIFSLQEENFHSGKMVMLRRLTHTMSPKRMAPLKHAASRQPTCMNMGALCTRAATKQTATKAEVKNADCTLGLPNFLRIPSIIIFVLADLTLLANPLVLW